jgi:uncharacterized protein
MHPDPGCLDLAERRKAFPRAFRTEGRLDLTRLRDWVEKQGDHQAPQAGRPPAPTEKERSSSS